MTSVPNSLDSFIPLADLIGQHARQQPDAPALRSATDCLDYLGLDIFMDQVASALQREGLGPGHTIALCAFNSVKYAAVFLGALRAGVGVAAIATSVSGDSFRQMMLDADARLLFADREALKQLAVSWPDARCVSLDGGGIGRSLDDWISPAGVLPATVAVDETCVFNIIYSSGTTGVPKGIVHSHRTRWMQMRHLAAYGYGPSARTLLSTPLYSNTTLVSLFPTLAFGGCAHIMSKFDSGRYLEIAAAERITHTMLVPVQYQRILDCPHFDSCDLSSFQMKFCTSAPFAPDLKADVLRRWPGALVEIYGMTEGGGACVLPAHQYPDKLHTVGKPMPDNDIRLIDESGVEVANGQVGEVVGYSPIMMTGYHRQPEQTREVEWHDPSGKRFIRTGDVGRFDEDGFLVLLDRRKDLIISGGFNVYPSDLEALLRSHRAVADAAVVGIASRRWGETPVAWVVMRDGETISPPELLAWFNARAGRTQRLSSLQFIDQLPRSAIGKVLKRALREAFAQELA